MTFTTSIYPSSPVIHPPKPPPRPFLFARALPRRPAGRTADEKVRAGTEADPDHPGLTGTAGLRSSKKAHGAMDCSFSLIFPERSLDFTASSK